MSPQPDSRSAPDEPEPLSDEDEERAAKLANRFDVRRIIGGLFLVYGVVLVVLGIVGSHTVKTKAAGIDIDLWSGLGMLVVAALMIAWALLSPVRPEPPEHRGRGSGRLRRTPAT